MKHHPVVGPMAGIPSCERSPQPSPILPLHAAIKELKGELPLCVRLAQSSFCSHHDTVYVEPPTSKCYDFPSLFKGFTTHYCAKPFGKAWKVTAFTHSWFSIKSTVYTSCLGKNHLLLLGWGVYTEGGSKGGIPVGGVSDDGGPPGS